MSLPNRYFYSYFFAGNVGSLKTQTSQITKTQLFGGGKKIDYSSTGAYEARVQNFRVLSLKNGVDIGH